MRLTDNIEVRLAALLVAAPLFGGWASELVRDIQKGSVRYSMIVGPLDRSTIEKEAVVLLGSDAIALGRMVVYENLQVATAVERESRLDECSWEALRTDLRSHNVNIAPGHCPPVTEALKIGRAIVIRHVDSECRTMTKLIRGDSDPREVEAMGSRHDIVAVSILSATSGQVLSHVFVRTASQLSTELGRQILNGLKTATGVHNMTAVVRNDYDFATHCSFPAPYLFGGPALVRTVEVDGDRAGGEVTCVARRGAEPHCWAYNGTP